MLIIPAVDIKGGKCVRLRQGDFQEETVYFQNPLEVVLEWQKRGAKRIHVVDLDGSRSGNPVSKNIIFEMARNLSVPLEVGGGIRSLNVIDDYLSMGVKKIVLGTAALKDEAFFLEACDAFHGSIILGIDARNGKVAVEGWIEVSEMTPVEIARRYETCGLDSIIYTDISRDGMETGVNIEATLSLAGNVSVPVIASGGVRDISDIKNLCSLPPSNIVGVIVGRALYSGALAIEDALDVAAETDAA